MISKTHLRDVKVTDEDYAGYLVRLYGDAVNDNLTWVDFKIYAFASIDADEPLFSGEMYPVPLDHAEVEVLAEGFVKWDGCTQFNADVHIDEESDLLLFNTALVETRRHARDLMGGTWLDGAT